MQNVSNGFYITALLNGTTINGYVRVENLPLIQRYTKGTERFVPDFEALAENSRPVVLPFLTYNDTGEVAIPSDATTVFKYNDVPLTFGADGICNTAGMAGVFKRLSYPATIGGQTYNIPAIRVMKNLVPLSNYDNDLITISGTVELGGQQLPFVDLSKEVIIEESSGNQYDLVISTDSDFAINTETDTLKLTALVYKDGVSVGDLTGFTFKWSKLLGTGEVEMAGIGNSQTITAADVDNVLKLRCDLYLSGSKIVSGFAEVTDYTDPYDVQFNITGVQGTQILKGQVARVTPAVVKRGSGDMVSGYKFTFNIKNNAGQDFIITGKESAQFDASYVDLAYADVVTAGRGINGYVTATKN